MQTFWDHSFLDGEHVRHWEDPAPGRSLDELRTAGLLPSGQRALDLGCGGGLEALHLVALGCRVLGVDTSVAALHVAAARTPPGASVRWCRASALALPVAPESLDLVHDRGCLHCLDEPATRRRYAAEVVRVLRPGGRFVVTGSRIDDDERGLSAVDSKTLDRHFPVDAWTRLAVEEVVLDAPAGPLPALRAVLVLR